MPQPTLRLAAWNLNHRIGRKTIAPAVIHALADLALDVLVLTDAALSLRVSVPDR